MFYCEVFLALIVADQCFSGGNGFKYVAGLLFLGEEDFCLCSITTDLMFSGMVRIP